MTPRAARIDRAYRARIRTLRQQTQARIETAWGSLTLDELDDRFPGFVERAAKTLTVAQVQGQLATRAYLRAMVQTETRRTFALAPPAFEAGTTEAGSIADGFAPIRPMVYAKLGESRNGELAMAFGLFLVGRLADNEVTRAVDTEFLEQAKDPESGVRGWVGTTFGATDDCVDNEGFHSFDEEPFRHPNCVCEISAGFDTP